MSASLRFDSFIRLLLEFETEFNKDGSVRVERDPHDPGGTTKYGIDQRSHPGVNVAALTKEQAVSIYWQDWLRLPCDELPCPLGELLMDIVQNGGQGARWIQEGLRLAGCPDIVVDGHIGPRTIAAAAAIAGSPPLLRTVVNTVCDQRAARFRSLPGAVHYLKGWLARNEKMRGWAMGRVGK